MPKHRPLSLRQPRIKHPGRIPNVWQLTQGTVRIVARHWRLLALIALVYGVLNLIFVRGFSGGTDVSSLKDQLNQLVNGNWGKLTTSASVFVVLLSSSGNSTSGTAGAYQIFLALVVSLTVIWTLRQLLAGERVRVRDGFYRGMYPLVPFLLVLAVIGLQCLPFLIGGELYSLVINNGIAVTLLEQLLWLVLFIVLAAITIRWLCSSLFALYIVTLPDMTPLKALRSARELVHYRRLPVFRKLLFLPVALFVAGGVIMIPIILFVAPLAPWVFFILTMAGLIVVHVYMYNLYRELLR